MHPSVRQVAFRSLRRCGAAGLFRSRKRRSGLVTVLALHRVTPERNFFWEPLTPALFDQLLAYCTRHYDIVSFREAVDSSARHRRPLLILSFDDGYYDFIEYGMPLLRKYGVQCNHNVIVDCVDQRRIPWTQELVTYLDKARGRSFRGTLRFGGVAYHVDGSDVQWLRAMLAIYHAALRLPTGLRTHELEALREACSVDPATVRMMDWDDIRRIAAEGVEIGSHTMSHDSLVTIADLDRLHYEVVESKHRLETELDRPVDTLAVPNGQYDERVLENVEGAGYRTLLLGGDALWHCQADPSRTPALIPRINMVEEDAAEMILRAEGFHQLVRGLFR